MRLIYIYISYILYKIKTLGRVKFEGFTVILKFKDSKITFGRNITIKSSFVSNLVGMSQRSILVARDGGSIEIGDNVGISGTTIYSLQSIKIGMNTMVGAGCKIIDNDFHPLEYRARIEDDRSKIKKKRVEIGEGCFIGMDSIILKGSKIGDRCIVGAGSVVNGEFPDYSIIAGNPAKIVKTIKEK